MSNNYATLLDIFNYSLYNNKYFFILCIYWIQITIDTNFLYNV